jgi:hypothetical protein
MRLYNLDSCTPVVSTNTYGTWSRPKTYLPQATNSIQLEGGLSCSPKMEKEELSIKVNSDFESPASHLRPCSSPSPSTLITDNDYGVVRQQRHDIFPSGNKFGFDIDDDEGSGFDDEISRMSSSTISTHTTLNALREYTEHEDTRYGIRTPFPTQSASTHHSGPPTDTPKHVSVISKGQPICDPLPKLKPPRDYPFPVVKPKKGASGPNTASQKASPNFGFVLGRKPAHSQEAPHACNSDSRSKRSRRDLLSTPEMEDFPCPQLAATESTEESSWLDFSVDGGGNPFHKQRQANASPFAPIEKAPVQKFNPVLVISPKPGRLASSASQAVIMPEVTQVASTHPVSLQDSSSVKSTPSDENTEADNGSVNDFQRPYVSIKKRSMATEPSVRLSRKTGGVSPMMATTGYPCQSLTSRPSRKGPDYSKYSSMITVGQPLDGVKSAMEEDHVDPSIIELITLASQCSNLRIG